MIRLKQMVVGTRLEKPARRFQAFVHRKSELRFTAAELRAQAQAERARREAAHREMLALKPAKLARIRAILKQDLSFECSELNFNFLTDSVRNTHGIVHTDNVSAHHYDEYALALIARHEDGLILDCGCGKRSIYYPNVVNFEVVPYDTTDVVGVGEELPFVDESFDAVLSLNVLEHVKDPFRCAAEIVRVMKPEATLYCVVPFLQPYHAYPHHYFNFTANGARVLFEPRLRVDSQEVISSGLPIWTLIWLLRSWAAGLEGRTLEAFLNMKVRQLVSSGPTDFYEKDFVSALSTEKNFELACTTALFATKPP